MTDNATRQLVTMTPAEELEDAELILDDFRRAKRYKGKRQFQALLTRANKALVTYYETPRLPYPLYTHNKPHSIPWSKQARDLYFSKAAIGGMLILEHIYPTDLKAKGLLERIDVSIHSAQDMLAWLHETYSGVALTVITKAEDQMLEGKWRTTVTEDGDVWGRYREAGLAVQEFMALKDDPRYATQATMRKINNGRKKAAVKN